MPCKDVQVVYCIRALHSKENYSKGRYMLTYESAQADLEVLGLQAKS